MADTSTRQQAHYEQIHDDYAAHYYDAASMAFRRRFVYRRMFDGVDLNGKTVADLACGSGYNSFALLEQFPSAKVTGFDISRQACDSYRAIVGAEAVQVDLTRAEGLGRQFDAAMIVGGLHHCVSDLPGTFRSISTLLRPGGVLLMWEPSSEFLLESMRKLWYRHDRYFDAQTEQALGHDRIAATAAASGFAPLRCTYSGGPAYFLIYNSLLFRIPVGLKKYLAPPLFAMERAYDLLPWKKLFPTFVAQWKKAGTAA